MKNGKKENQSFSCPDYLLELLDRHIKNINKNSFNKIDRSSWLCKAIRTQLIIEKAELPEFWESIARGEMDVILQDNTE